MVGLRRNFSVCRMILGLLRICLILGLCWISCCIWGLLRISCRIRFVLDSRFWMKGLLMI